MTSPDAAKLRVQLAEVIFYQYHPITESFADVLGFPFCLAQWQTAFPSVFEKAPQSPTGITTEVLKELEIRYRGLISKIESSTPLTKEEEGVLPNIPPNLPELIAEMEASKKRRQLPPDVKDRLSANLEAARKAVVTNWERRRLEIIEEKLKTTRQNALNKAQNIVSAKLEIYARENPVVAATREYIAEDVHTIIEEASQPQNDNAPEPVEEINKNAKQRIEDALVKNYGLSEKIAQEISSMVLADEATKKAIEAARKTTFAEQALKNQFSPGVNEVSPEALQNLADETTADIMGLIIQPVQEELSLQQKNLFSLGLFRTIKTKIAPPFGLPFITPPASMVQNAREIALVNTLNDLLQKGAVRLSPELLKKVGPVSLDAVQAVILEAANFANTAFWEHSLSNGSPFGRIHPQVRNSTIINKGTLEGFERFLPHVQFRFLHGLSIPFIGKLYQPNEWGYVVGPLARLKNAALSKTVQFVGGSLIKVGQNAIIARLGGKVLFGLGLKLLGIAGGPIGLVVAFAPQILSLSEKIFPAVKAIKILQGRFFKTIGGFAAGGLFLFLTKLAQLGWAATGAAIGGTLGSVGGFIFSGFNPLGVLAGGAIGSFFGAIIGSLIAAISGETGAATAAVSSAAVGATSVSAPAASAIGSLAPPSLAVASVLTATIGVGTVALLENQVTQQAFYSETRRLNVPFLDIVVKELKDIFEMALKDPQSCLPLAVLKAIANVETGGIIFTYNETQVKRFSAAGWEQREKIDQKQPCCDKGASINYACNNNTCSQTTNVPVCPPIPLPAPICDVVGPMQFEAGTFSGYVQRLESLWDHVGPDGLKYPPSRANLKDAILAAALKIKANSGRPDCGPWDDDTIIRVARAYCGSCGSDWCDKGEQRPGETLDQCRARIEPFCGKDYCGNVLRLYKNYQ